MNSSKRKCPEQLKLFFELSVLLDKSAVPPLFSFSEDITPGRINHMMKFKPFHEFQKPLIELTPEMFLNYIETVIPKDHLSRLVKEVVFSLDTESLEAKYSFSG